MNDECVHHDEVRRAATTGVWSPELAAHATTCPMCADTVLVSGCLRRLAGAEELLAPPLPESHALFTRSRLAARLLREQEIGERATRALMLAEIAAAIVLLAAGTGWLWSWLAPPLALLAAMSWPLVLAAAFAARRLAWALE